MGPKARTTEILLAAGLGVGLALAGVGAALFWTHERSDASRASVETGPDGLDDIDALKAEVQHRRGGRSDSERRSAKLTSELAWLRSELARLEEKQARIARDVDRRAGAGFEQSEASGGDDAGAVAELTPEEEAERAETQITAQVESIEDTILREKRDPEWSSEAELALTEAYRSDEMPGVGLVDAECGSTVCRVELSFDGSASPEQSIRDMVHLAPWAGPGFFVVDGIDEGDEPPAGVFYLAREGYSLPQSTE
jgi:hypothetical protein